MNQDILNGIQGNPEIMQSVQMAVQELLQDPDIDRESVEQIIRMIEFVLQNPDSYEEFRQTVVQGELLDAEDLPDQFNAEMLTVVLLALKVVQQQMADGGPGFARGGLNKIAQMGRRGDSELAHITPFEGRLLQAYGGSGGMNPYTDMPEYSLRRKLKKVFKAIAPVLPVVLSFVAPGFGTALGSMLSGGALAAGTAGASMLGGAAIGGLSSAAAGGNALQGALGGALGAGAGSALGGAVSDATGMALGKTAQNVIGSSLIGGAQGAISGEGFGAGALQGATGGYLGSTLGGAASGIGGKVGAGLQTAGQQFGNALTMGATPQDALSQGALSGLAAAYAAPSAAPKKSIYDITPSDTGGLGLKAPSDLAVEGLRAPATNTASFPSSGLGVDYSVNSGMTPTFRGPETMAADYSIFGQPQAPVASAQPEMGTGIQASPLNTIAAQTAELTPGTKGTVNNASANKGFSVGNAAAMLPLLSMFSGAQTPEEIQQVVSTMSPEQREYFSRPLRTWNWDMLGAAAKMEGIPIGNYIARNWDKVGGGSFDRPEEEAVPKLAEGGLVPVSGGDLSLMLQRFFGRPLNDQLTNTQQEPQSPEETRPQKPFFQRFRERAANRYGIDFVGGKWVDRGTGAALTDEQKSSLLQDPKRLALYQNQAPGQNLNQNLNPSQSFDFSKIQQLADQQGLNIHQFLARNFGSNFPTVSQTPKLARGGALNRVAFLASGGGTGRSDSIDAKLSDGEYVMDAETVALIGDGSTNAGARRLDQMRSKIRQHKGKSMARGKFSANAKSPLAYLKGA